MATIPLPSSMTELIHQWASYRIAKLSKVSKEDPKIVMNKATRGKPEKIVSIFQNGCILCENQSEESLNLFSKTCDLLLNNIIQHPQFPSLFSYYIQVIDTILEAPYEPVVIDPKAKVAIHTEQIEKKDDLSPVQKQQCEILEFTCKFLKELAKSNPEKIDNFDKDIIKTLFNYLKPDKINTMRSSAGKIISVLSYSYKYTDTITKYLWLQFRSCKKDDDFRNFTAYVDGIANLHFSLETQESTTVYLSFLKTFCDNEKRIERGVLRMKMLESLLTDIQHAESTSKDTSRISGYSTILENIFNIVTKWSSKSKHTEFCMTFLAGLLGCTDPNFFMANKHTDIFLERVCKFCKNGSVPGLNSICTFYKKCPTIYYQDHIDVFASHVQKHIIPLLFAGNEKKRSCRFIENQQVDAIVSILSEIGKKQITPIVDFARTVFPIDKPTNEHIFVRQIVLRVLSEVARSNPAELEKHNQVLFMYMVPVLLQQLPYPHELEYAIETFPLIHPLSPERVGEITQALFSLALSNDETIAACASLSITKYIETLCSFQINPLDPIVFISAILNGIMAAHPMELMHNVMFLSGLINSLTIMYTRIGKNTDGIDATALEWNRMRNLFDKVTIPLMFHPLVDINMIISLQRQFGQEVYKSIDTICGGTDVMYMSDWFLTIPEMDYKPDDFIEVARGLPDFNKQLSEKAFNIALEFISIKGLDPMQQQEADSLTSLMIAIAGSLDDSVRQFFNNIFDNLNKKANNPDVMNTIQMIPDRMLIPFIQCLQEYKTKKQITMDHYWKPHIAIYAALSDHENYNAMLEREDMRLEFEKFFAEFWTVPREKVTAESVPFYIMYFDMFNKFITQSTTKLSNIMNNFDKMPNFIESMTAAVNQETIQIVTPELIKSLFRVLMTISTVTQFGPNAFFEHSFSNWLLQVSKAYQNNKEIIPLITELLTTILKHNVYLIQAYHQLSIDESPLYAMHSILAIANCISDDFLKQENVAACVALVTITHLGNEAMVCRQAAARLLCAVQTNGGLAIFTEKIPESLAFTATFTSPFVYSHQIEQFRAFIRKSLRPEIAASMIEILAEVTKLTPNAEGSKYFIGDVVYRIDDSERADALQSILVITNVLHVSQNPDFSEIQNTWRDFFAINDKSIVEPIVTSLIDFGVDYTDEARIAASKAFEAFPEETAKVLLPVICKYSRATPSPSAFMEYVQAGEIDFSFTDREIFVANAVSDIILRIVDGRLFWKIFHDDLPEICLFAVFFTNYKPSNSTVNLLDSLIDAVLVRFVPDSLKLKARTGELLKAGFDGIYPIQHDICINPSTGPIADSQEKTRAIFELFGEVDGAFQPAFYECAFATALHIAVSKRAYEAFLVLAAIDAQSSPKSSLYILLYMLNAIRVNRNDLVKALLTAIRQRIISEHAEFQTEALPVIVTIFLVANASTGEENGRLALTIISEVCDRVIATGYAEELSKSLLHFFRKDKRDTLMASIIVHCASRLKYLTAGDAELYVNTLYKVSSVFPEPSFCFAAGLTLDAVRTILGCAQIKKDEDCVKGIKEFAEYVSTKFNEEMYTYVVMLLCDIVASFAAKDADLCTLAAELISSIAVAVPPLQVGTRNTAVRILALSALTAEGEQQSLIQDGLAQMLTEKGRPVPTEFFSLRLIKPEFEAIKQKIPLSTKVITVNVVSQHCFPKTGAAAKIPSDVAESFFNNGWLTVAKAIVKKQGNIARGR